MDQTELLKQIETHFAAATPTNARETIRTLERLVRQVHDPRTRARYENAIDVLPDMLKHLDG